MQTYAPEHLDRTRSLTPSGVNRKIDAKTEESVRSTLSQGSEAVNRRLKELDREWHIDRVLMLNFAVLVFAQLLAARKNKKWLWGPLVQLPFLAMHAIVGWCPPSLWFRPMGFRTRQEIETERESLLFGAGATVSN
jgi:hypothetical protein